MVVLLAAFAGYAQTLLDLNFEAPDNTVGQLPTGLGVSCSPGSTVGNNHMVVIGAPTNTAGSGQGVEIVDNDATAGTRFEATLINPQTVMQFDFSFSPERTDGSGANYFNAAVMVPGGSAGSSADRFCSMRMFDNGTVRFYAGVVSGSVGISQPALPGTAYKATFLVNDGITSVPYVTNNLPGNVLAADSVAFWLNGAYIGSGLLTGGGGAGTISGGTNGLAKIGFGSTTAMLGLYYYVDNIKVTKIVPPAGPGTLSLYLLGE